MSRPEQRDSLLAEQIAYCRAIAPEYDDHAIPGPGEEELLAALDAFQPTGDVLELACRPGVWTKNSSQNHRPLCLARGVRHRAEASLRSLPFRRGV